MRLEIKRNNNSLEVFKMLTTEQWQMHEITLAGTQTGNPFTDVFLKAVFRHDVGYIETDGFYVGGGVYKIRFMPTVPGKWTYRTQSGDPALDGKTGEILCGPATGNNRGPVRVKGKYYFAHADGTRHISIGTTCYAWIYQTGDLIEKTFSELEKYGFNKIRMCVFPKHYDYNLKEPEHFPFIKDADGGFDFTRLDPVFFNKLDRIISRLSDSDIQADLILFHPYDRWGFASMPPDADDRYLRYMAARYSAYKNVWWSFANEYDLMTNMGGASNPCHKDIWDWERFAKIICAHDPYGHLRSIHNCGTFYDHTKPWVTHCSVQGAGTDNADKTRRTYGKPVVYDECEYEGNIQHNWGNISGQEMTKRFWLGAVYGGFVGHGETYLGHDGILWWSHGGKLHGESPERIRFMKKILEEVPEDIELYPQNDAYSIHYFDIHRPSFVNFSKPDGKYTADIIDTWNMTVDRLPETFTGDFTVKLPGREHMAIRLIKL